MKVREREHRDGGLGGGGFFVRVVEVDDDKVPDGAVQVAKSTPLEDWRQERPEEAPAEET